MNLVTEVILKLNLLLIYQRPILSSDWTQAWSLDADHVQGRLNLQTVCWMVKFYPVSVTNWTLDIESTLT